MKPHADILEALNVDEKVKAAFEELNAAADALAKILVNAEDFEEISGAWQRLENAVERGSEAYVTLKNAWEA